MNRKDTKNFLITNKFIPSKKMGQSFLVNQEISEQIVSSLDLINADVIVEIGPGLGALTSHLVKTNKPLIAIELDKRLADNLTKTYPQIKVINNDVLKVNFNLLLKEYSNPLLVSNLPYSISSPMLRAFFKSNLKKFYCLLQKEFVQRLIAAPNSKEYSALSVCAQYMCDIKRIVDVNRTNFNPVPKVDSCFISLIKTKKYDEKFFGFVNLCFAHRRKTLVNNLRNTYGYQSINACLTRNNINVNIRAQELTIGQLYNLHRGLNL